jgi:hypothetical protein
LLITSPALHRRRRGHTEAHFIGEHIADEQRIDRLDAGMVHGVPQRRHAHLAERGAAGLLHGYLPDPDNAHAGQQVAHGCALLGEGWPGRASLYGRGGIP